jgi:hypothetical protein
MDIQGILGIDEDVRNGFSGVKVTYKIDADAKREDIEALVAQSQKRSAVYDSECQALAGRVQSAARSFPLCLLANRDQPDECHGCSGLSRRKPIALD